ncbi:Ceramide synthase 3 [Schistosoma japonicum]|nr:Ceramide synthase 3 [Schistosoma japonicum]
MIVGRCYGCYGFYTLALVVSTFLTNTANKIYLYHISVFKMHYFIWNEKFWLPPNVTWELIQEINSVGISPTLTKTMDCFCVVALLTVIRHYLKECVFIPHGLSFGLRIPKISHVPAAPVLEKVYKKEHKPTQTQIKELSEALNLSDRCIESWFRKRRNQEKFPIIVKFVESEWRLCYYTIMFLYGLFALYDKSYFWDVKETMLNYPYHVLTPEIHWYYMVQLGYYTASSIWIFYEVKRSDFKVLLGHHISTVSLLVFSYLTNFHRIGAIVLLLHDIADCWMEAAKICKYINKNLASEVVIWTTIKLGPVENGIYPGYVIMNGFLLVLQILHIYWFCLIVKIAVQVKSHGRLFKDCRSESELSDESTHITKSNLIHKKNYHVKQTSLKDSDDVQYDNNNNDKLNHVYQRSTHCIQLDNRLN